jgi:hypothetical protein
VVRVRWAAVTALLSIALVAGVSIGSRGADTRPAGAKPATPLESAVRPAQPFAAVSFEGTAAVDQRALRAGKSALPFALAPAVFTLLAAVRRRSSEWRRDALGKPAARTRRHSIVLRAPPSLASV